MSKELHLFEVLSGGVRYGKLSATSPSEAVRRARRINPNIPARATAAFVYGPDRRRPLQHEVTHVKTPEQLAKDAADVEEQRRKVFGSVVRGRIAR